MRFLMILLLCFALPTAAAPKDDVHKAYTRFLGMKTFRADIDSSTGKLKLKSSLEFQAPDRYRVTNEGQPSNLIIGDTMHMDMNGSMMKIPMPGLKDMIAQYRNPKMLAELEAGTAVESLGIEVLNMQPTRKYRYTTTKPHVTSNLMWVSVATGDVLQIESNGNIGKKPFHTLIRYSQYNSPAIKISAP